jgi:hypothetical protein
MEKPPVDVNKLMSILAKSRAVMKTVESGSYETGNVDGNALVQETVDTLPSGQAPTASRHSNNAHQITESMIDNSKLPDAIKQAMKNSPIPQATGPTHTFTLDDVQGLVEKKLPIPSSKQKQVVRENIQPPIYEQSNSLSENNIRLIVQEEMTKFFSGYFMKQITETIQKQTIKNLLDSGIIKKKTTTK